MARHSPGVVGRWTFHHPRTLLAIAFAGCVGTLLLDVNASSAGLAVQMVALGVYIRSHYSHGPGLCRRCMEAWQRVGLAGLLRATQQYRRYLELQHWLSSRVGIAAMTITLVVYLVVYFLFTGHTLVQITATAALYAEMALLARTNRIHHWLTPWCPWCRDDGDGGGGGALLPEPDPALSRQR